MTANAPLIGIAILVYVSIAYLLSMLWRRNDIADVFWGPGIFLAAATALLTSGHTFGSAPLAYLICGLIALWAARIAWQIGRRFLSKSEEDQRYAHWRKSWQFFYLRSYVQVFVLQGVLMILVAMSAFGATMFGDGRQYQSAVVIVGVVVFLFGFLFEALADMQLNAFVKAQTDKSQVLTTGLWRYSRHPNYFGEVTTWWGLWLIAIAPAMVDPTVANLAIALMALISPVTITILILKVSGIPMLEAKYVGNTAFDSYKQRTSAFFPRFPGKQAVPQVETARTPPQRDYPTNNNTGGLSATEPNP